MDIGHTSGPWEAHTFEPETSKSHYVTAGPYIPICKTGRWDLASAADARLIAAAPDLLEALKNIIGGENRYEINYDDYMRAVSAIAKAEGAEGRV